MDRLAIYILDKTVMFGILALGHPMSHSVLVR